MHIFLVLAVSSLGLAFYFFQKDLCVQDAVSGGSDVVVDYKTEITSFNTMILNLDTHISQLRAINSDSRHLESQVVQVHLAALTPSAQIAQLEGVHLILQAMIRQSQDASLVGSFFYRNKMS